MSDLSSHKVLLIRLTFVISLISVITSCNIGVSFHKQKYTHLRISGDLKKEYDSTQGNGNVAHSKTIISNEQFSQTPEIKSHDLNDGNLGDEIIKLEIKINTPDESSQPAIFCTKLNEKNIDSEKNIPADMNSGYFHDSIRNCIENGMTIYLVSNEKFYLVEQPTFNSEDSTIYGNLIAINEDLKYPNLILYHSGKTKFNSTIDTITISSVKNIEFNENGEKREAELQRKKDKMIRTSMVLLTLSFVYVSIAIPTSGSENGFVKSIFNMALVGAIFFFALSLLFFIAFLTL